MGTPEIQSAYDEAVRQLSLRYPNGMSDEDVAEIRKEIGDAMFGRLSGAIRAMQLRHETTRGSER